jgi:microcystin-dependent protein
MLLYLQLLGTTYGAGDGSTTFNLPDLTDKVAVHKSNNKNFASTGGANTVAPTGNVAGSTANATLSTAQLASHSHTQELPAYPGSENAGIL